MDLLDKLMELQERHGALSDETLRAVARETRQPLYRLEGLRSFYPALRKSPAPPTEVKVCRDIVCAMRGGESLAARLRDELGGGDSIGVEPVSCIGRCDEAPAALVNEAPCGGGVERWAAMARRDTARGEPPPIGDRSERQPQRWPTDPYDSPAERYGTLRTLLARGGTVGADDASGAAGNAAREEAIATLKDSGLRGMGGAGFPAGAKWDYTRRAEGNPKYVVCNADESEPGTFKDREILAQLPYLMLEAMAIAGWAIGAEEGIVYLRHEYGRERELLKEAIREAERMGALGDGVFGTSFRFQVRLFVSPGGYILGEETALLEALEDRRG
ncbi:MAG: NAD(P)H-dependent oxidoreductase subunit E, partial [SAR324 cluster bacterium]|nr:NAD(P)H-dependent oxidoreductase subunit E [SAR324 cluster bacterium]